MGGSQGPEGDEGAVLVCVELHRHLRGTRPRESVVLRSGARRESIKKNRTGILLAKKNRGRKSHRDSVEKKP